MHNEWRARAGSELRAPCERKKAAERETRGDEISSWIKDEVISGEEDTLVVASLALATSCVDRLRVKLGQMWPGR